MLRTRICAGVRGSPITLAVVVLTVSLAAVVSAQTVDDWILQYTGAPLYPSQYGLPGRPGLDPDKKEFSAVWGFPERTAYPGSVEHVRTDLQRYLPMAPVRNAKTLFKNF